MKGAPLPATLEACLSVMCFRLACLKLQPRYPPSSCMCKIVSTLIPARPIKYGNQSRPAASEPPDAQSQLAPALKTDTECLQQRMSSHQIAFHYEGHALTEHTACSSPLNLCCTAYLQDGEGLGA